MNDAADPAGYRAAVAADLKWMRDRSAKLTQREMSQRLSAELGRRIPDSSVSRWENGTKLAGADVYRAYLVIAGLPLPRDVRGQDPRALPNHRLADIEAQLQELRRSVFPAAARPGAYIPLDDLATVMVAARERGRSRQTIHNWILKGEIRWAEQGRRVLVSLSDVLAHE